MCVRSLIALVLSIARIQLSTRNSEHVGQVATRSLSEIAYPDSLSPVTELARLSG